MKKEIEPKYKIGDVIIIANNKNVRIQGVIIRAYLNVIDGTEWNYWIDPTTDKWIPEREIIKKI